MCLLAVRDAIVRHETGRDRENGLHIFELVNL